MLSDDLTALAAISMGTLASAALTFAVVAYEPEAPDDMGRDRPTVVAPARDANTCVAPAPLIDFAIIRSGGDRAETDLMVGPEDDRSGWATESLQMRLLRGR